MCIRDRSIIDGMLEAFYNEKKDDEEITGSLFYNREKNPLVRLKIEFSGTELIHTQKLELKYNERVANHGDVIKMVKRKVVKKEVPLSSKFNEGFFNAISHKEFAETTDNAGAMIREIFEREIAGMKKPTLIHPAYFLEHFTTQDIKHKQGFDGLFENILTMTGKHVFSSEMQNAQNEHREFLELLEGLHLSDAVEQGRIDHLHSLAARDIDTHLRQMKPVIKERAQALVREKFDMLAKVEAPPEIEATPQFLGLPELPGKRTGGKSQVLDEIKSEVNSSRMDEEEFKADFGDDTQGRKFLTSKAPEVEKKKQGRKKRNDQDFGDLDMPPKVLKRSKLNEGSFGTAGGQQKSGDPKSRK
eukprot:TRINITY_DN4808_c0_g2_i1.p1 TRINITY_DN4808_c0_g2~~TRINITY_DN4808_c0_g2_i1.p1  ORF type:complete len:359 (-),score=109.43 TRINITY_DN4808_c0_g2_i1:128-1204(-)